MSNSKSQYKNYLKNFQRTIIIKSKSHTIMVKSIMLYIKDMDPDNKLKVILRRIAIIKDQRDMQVEIT